MKTTLIVLIIFLSLTIASAGCCAGFVISTAGEAQCVVVTADIAGKATATAANELARVLSQVSGGEYKAVSESNSDASQAQILVGRCPRVEFMLKDQDWGVLGPDGVLIKTIGNKLIISGATDRGTMNAVNLFLERVIGCRWWTESDSTIPNKPDISVPNLDYVYCPPFTYRGISADNAVGLFATKLHLNGRTQDITQELGSHTGILMGKPAPGICPNDGKLYSWMVNSLDSKLRFDAVAANRPNRSRRASLVYLNTIETQKPCQCAWCRDLAKKYSTASAGYVQFANRIAHYIESQYAGIQLIVPVRAEMGDAPQKIAVKNSAILSMDLGGSDLSKPLGDPNGPDWNKRFEQTMAGWQQLYPQTWIQGRIVSSGGLPLPYPNILSLPITLRCLVANKVTGAMLDMGSSQTPVDFRELRLWLASEMLWDPQADEMKLMKQFTDWYYGPAGKFLLSYLMLVNGMAGKSTVYVCPGNTDFSFMDIAAMNRAKVLMDAAVKAVYDIPVFQQRVIKEKLFLDALWLLRYKDLRTEAALYQIPFTGPEDPEAAAEQFKKAASLSGMELKDGVIQGLKLIACSRPASPPKLDGSWVDRQESWFALKSPDGGIITDDPKASDGNALRMNLSTNSGILRAPVNVMGKYKCIVYMRIKPGLAAGKVCSVSIEDTVTNSFIVGKEIISERGDPDEYVPVDLGVQDMNQGYEVVIRENGDAGSAESVWIDRFCLVKQEEPKDNKAKPAVKKP